MASRMIPWRQVFLALNHAQISSTSALGFPNGDRGRIEKKAIKSVLLSTVLVCSKPVNPQQHVHQISFKAQVNKSSFRVSFSSGFRDNNIVRRNIAMKDLPILKQRPVAPHSIM